MTSIHTSIGTRPFTLHVNAQKKSESDRGTSTRCKNEERSSFGRTVPNTPLDLDIAKVSILDEALVCKKTSQLLYLAGVLGCFQDDVARAVDAEDAKGELIKIVKTKTTSVLERAAAQELRQKE